MDAFAAAALRFEHAHTQVGNCMPCRNVLMTGLYPHQNGVEGFRQLTDGHKSQLCDDFRTAGYLTAIRGKATHSNPFHPYPGWDLQLTETTDKKRDQKRPDSFGESTASALEQAKAVGKPLFLSINISDPHLPFYAYDARRGEFEDANKPSRIFTETEITIPGFLFDHPTVRTELAHYYSSVRRADDAFGSILNAIDHAGAQSNTLVVFLSDHGMPLPFAKTQLYHHSTHTPLMVRWPGHTHAGSVDATHMVSTVDIAPTLLEATGTSTEREMSGRSFAPLLIGESQSERDYVIKTYYENSGRNRQPMRSIQSKTLGYIFNPWSGKDASGQRRNFATATDGTRTYKTMVELAKSDSAIATRLELMDHRVPEELYDYKADPDALNNLIESPAHQRQLNELREALTKGLRQIDDPLASVFASRNADEISQYMDAVDREMAEIKATSKKKAASAGKRKQRNDLIDITAPKSFQPGETTTLTIAHNFAKRLGEQMLTITLKNADGKRLERKTVTVTGGGAVDVSFDVAKTITALQFAVFVGDDYPSTPQHVSTSVVLAQ